MGLFDIDFNQFAPSTKPLKQKVVTPIVQPTIQPKSTLQPTSQPAPAPMPVQQPQDQSWVQKGFNLLNKPSELVQSGITRLFTGKDQTYEEALKGTGMPDMTRNVVGFAGRLIADPLNFIPVAKVAKLIGKVPGVAKTVGAVSKVAEVPFVKSAIEGVGKKFVRGYGLPEAYSAAKTDISYKTAAGATKIIENMQKLFGQPKNWFQKNILRQEGTSEFSQKAIEAFPKFLEPNAYINTKGTLIKGAGFGEDLAVLRKELGSEFNKMLPVLKEVRKTLDDEVTDLVKRGRMTGEAAKDALTRGGYFPHTDFAPKRLKDQLLSKFGAKLGERRTYLETRKGAEGFTFNAPRVIAQRELNQLQDNVIQDFLKGVKQQFGIKIGKGQAVPEGFVPVLSSSKRLLEVNGWAFPKNITDDLNMALSETGGIARGIDLFNQYWKPTATSINPAFHLMNVMGNLYNSWLGGMKDPRKIAQAIAGIGLDPAEKAIIEKSGVLARGQFGHATLKQTFDSPDLVDPNRVLGLFRRTGNFFENNARSAFFLDQREKLLRKGLSDVEATRQAVGKVNEYLFDYLTGLTPFEQNVMRRIFPFYTWARFNIPLQFKNIITQPDKSAVVAKFQKAFNQGGIPEGDQPGISFPTPFTDEKGEAIRYRPNLPIQDIFNATNPLEYAKNSANPLFKEVPQVGAWLATGGKFTPMDLYSGQPRTDTDLPFSEQVKDVIGSEAKSLIRPGRVVSKLMEEPSLSNIGRQLVGGTYTIPAQSVKLRSVREKLNKNQAIQNRIERINRSNLSQEDKDRQIERLLKFLK